MTVSTYVPKTDSFNFTSPAVEAYRQRFFRVLQVPPGTYIVTTSAAGFKDKSVSGEELKRGVHTTLDFTLEIL